MAHSSSYPTLNADQTKLFGIRCKSKEFSFERNGENTILKAASLDEDQPNVLELEADDYFIEFKPTLRVTLTLSFNNLEFLFGRDGVSYQDSTVAIGLIWKSRRGRIRHCKKLGSISNQDSNDLEIFGCFDIEDTSTNVDITWVLYLEKPGTKKGDLYFGNEEGLILGSGNLFSLVFDGVSSLFPLVVEEHGRDFPLWRVRVDQSADDELDSLFDVESACILINKDHRSYEMIDQQSGKFNIGFFNEVISSSLATLIVLIRETFCQDDGHFNIAKEYDAGTIGADRKSVV